MACASCGSRPKKNNRAPSAVLSNTVVGIDFTKNEPTSARVVSTRGVMRVDKSLLTSKPRTGWKVAILLNGITQVFTGTSYTQVFEQVKQFYALNNVKIDDLTIHFNLNLTWTENQLVKNAVVKHIDLKSLLKTTVIIDTIRPSSVLEDGGKDWSYIGRHLAVAAGEYDEVNFLLLLGTERKLLASPSIGCPKCLEHFDAHIETGQLGNAFDTLTTARQWMHGVMNQINKAAGKRELTFLEAKRKHNWL